MARYERSCGLVIYHQSSSAPREFLLLHYPTGHWDFAKGHVERDEADLATALREAKEETGLENLDVAGDFRHEFEYWYRHRDATIHKKVTWFVGRAKDKGVKISHEHQGYVWLPFEQAVQRVTYDNARDLLRRAEAHLSGAPAPPKRTGAAQP